MDITLICAIAGCSYATLHIIYTICCKCCC